VDDLVEIAAVVDMTLDRNNAHAFDQEVLLKSRCHEAST